MPEITVIVATFGDWSWQDKAKAAVASAHAQTVPVNVVQVHGKTLHGARNSGAIGANTEWLLFLDADDALDEGYAEAMLRGDGDLRQPETIGVYPDGRVDDLSVFIAPRGPNLLSGNHLVIGTLIRKRIFDEAGGFRDLQAWEDYDLFVRCWLAGARIGQAPGAVYRVGVNPGGRNDLSSTDAAMLFALLRAEYDPIARAKGFQVP